ncbi:hypothetical protein VM98_33735, partial [Streptomyces rubellomurinus subsp. indigoferus]
RPPAARGSPGDVPAFPAAARTAQAGGVLRAARARGLGRHGHPYPVELWARVPSGISHGRTHLLSAVLDVHTLTAAAAAVDRLRETVFALDPDARIPYAKRGIAPLLGVRREDLVGRHPWDALPWLADPFYENRYRA